MHSVSLSEVQPARSGGATRPVVRHCTQPPVALDRPGVNARAFRHNHPTAKNSNQAYFATPSHASPFRHSEKQLRSRRGGLEVKLPTPEALQRARQIKLEVRL